MANTLNSFRIRDPIAAIMQFGKSLFQSQAHLDCWIDARRCDEPPDDFAGRFAGRFICEGRNPQRAGIAPPHAAGDGLSGAASDGDLFGFISGLICCVGGVPLMRARNP